jgi:glutaredoxin 2
MAKQCGVDKEIKALEIADKKYKDFLATKELQEDKLFHTVRDIGTQLTAKLERLNKVREWNKSFDDFKPKENGVDYFTNKLDDCCYDEAYRLAKKSHKVYNKLQDMKTASRVILHTGSDINSTVTTLKSEMAKAGIDLPVPTHLLQLSQ